jgi:hypothetical protein
MEFPDDVLGLIRLYSRPRFKHFCVYNQAVKVLEKDDVSLHDLKEKLQSDPDKLVPVLVSYMEALLQRKIDEQSLNLYNCSHPPSLTKTVSPEWNRLMGVQAYSRHKEIEHYRKLICSIYGIKSSM